MGTRRLYDYAASGNCYKVRLLLAQLGRPYERVSVDIFDGETLTDESAAKNPARSTPLLELEDGTFLAESNAILTYLAQGTPFMPSDPLGVAQVVRWLIFEQTDMMMTMGGLRFRLLTGRFTADSPRCSPQGRRARRPAPPRRASGGAVVPAGSELHGGRHRGIRLFTCRTRSGHRDGRLPGGAGLVGAHPGSAGIHERPGAVGRGPLVSSGRLLRVVGSS